ncbi:membrane protease YdiL (CAAX protease family) [Actinopolyspora lacussalsi]|nr:membrane protease YdiL (CAAX protease family) [Actinopolyspora lacussalsi]
MPTRPLDASAPPIDTSRPFGAHVRMNWWKPLVIVSVLPVVMVLLQIVFYYAAAVIAGRDDPLTNEMTPLTLLANNLSVGVTGLLALSFVVRLAEVPWHSLLSSSRRLDSRRWKVYSGGSTLLVAAGVALVALVAPGDTGWTGFEITNTTVALLLVVVLTTPLQAAGEELIFRGTMLPAIASWVPAARWALLTGLVGSSMVFALIHGSADPWLLGYFTVVGVCTGLMAVISRGLEAPIAFHVCNNLVVTLLNSLFADGGTSTYERSVGAGGPSYLILAAVNLAVVGLVWLCERGWHRPGRWEDRTNHG